MADLRSQELIFMEVSVNHISHLSQWVGVLTRKRPDSLNDNLGMHGSLNCAKLVELLLMILKRSANKCGGRRVHPGEIRVGCIGV